MDVEEDRGWFVRDGDRDGNGACRGRKIEIDDDVLHAVDHVELVQRLRSGSRRGSEHYVSGHKELSRHWHVLVLPPRRTFLSCCLAGSKYERSLGLSGRPRLQHPMTGWDEGRRGVGEVSAMSGG